MSGFPRMAEIAQLFPDRSIPDVEGTVKSVLEGARLGSILNPGERVAVTAGSRGIKNIDLIIKTVVRYISSCGCRPFVISAMGSHGGSTVSGQLAILGDLGITPENIGAQVLASEISLPLPAENGEVFYVSSLAFEFDRIIVLNRVKPHTSFHGPAESGLQKMLAVGLGGPGGASRIHCLGVEALPAVIPRAAAAILKHLPVALGVAILEDSRENTMRIEAVPPREFVQKELVLLDEARSLMPGLPFEKLDILVVDQIGKVFSGTGMDTNVVGRIRINGVAEPSRPAIKRIIALDLAAGSKGNAYGVGLTDFTTRRLVDGIDYEAVYVNALTSTFIMRAMVPMTCPDDRSAIQSAIKSLGRADPESLRMVRIKNTLNLDRMLISESLLEEAGQNKMLKITREPENMDFDGHNNLLPF
ncbi:MAG: nickel pincer cofactor-dependent isomerase, group 22 [Desulfocucumaceae bacterium]